MISCSWSSLDGPNDAPRPSLHDYDELNKQLVVAKRLARKPSKLHTSIEVTRCRFGSTSRQAAPVGLEEFIPRKEWNPISYAVYHDREAALQHFLQTGISPDSTEGSGVSLLCIAAACGHFEIAEILLTAGAEVDLGTENMGETAMHVAIKAGRHDIVDLLLVHSANLESRTLHTGQTALHYAAAAPAPLAMVTKLLRFGAQYDVEDTQGRTPAVVALQTHNLQAALAIINMARGKRKQLVKEKGMLLQHVEKAKDQESVTNDLIAGVFAATCDPDSTVLIEAIKKNDAILVQMLLDEGVDPKQGAATGLLPLFVAVKFSDLRIIKLLIQHGADVIGRGPGNLDILQFFFKTFTTRDEGSIVTIVEYLLTKGADCMARYPDGRTLLHRVTSMKTDYAGLVKLLIRNGIPIDAQDKNCTTALHLAASNGLSSSIKTLIDYHTDRTIVDSQTRTALLRAIQNQQWFVVPFLAVPPALTSRDAEGSTALHHIAQSIPKNETTWEEIAGVVKWFCARSVCRSMRDRSGATPLIQAIRSLPETGLPLVEALLNEGDRSWNCVGHEDHKGHDALYYAAILGKIVFVKALLEHDAPLNVKEFADAQRRIMMATTSTDRVLELLNETDRLRSAQECRRHHDDSPWMRIEIVRSEPRASSAMSGYHADCEMERKAKGHRSASNRSSSLRHPHPPIQHRTPVSPIIGFPTRTSSTQQQSRDSKVVYNAPTQRTHARVSSATSLNKGSFTNTKTVRFTRHNDHLTETTGRSSPVPKPHESYDAFPPRTSSRQQTLVSSMVDMTQNSAGPSLCSKGATVAVRIPSIDGERTIIAEPSDSETQTPSVPLMEPVNTAQTTPTLRSRATLSHCTTVIHDQSTEGSGRTLEKAVDSAEPEKLPSLETSSSTNARGLQPTRIDSAVSVTVKAETANAQSTLEHSQATPDRIAPKTKRQSADELTNWLAISNMMERL